MLRRRLAAQRTVAALVLRLASIHDESGLPASGCELDRQKGALMRYRLLTVAALAVSLCACGASTTPTAKPTAPARPRGLAGQQTDLPLSNALLNATLTTSAGQHVSLASLAGKTLVLSDLMTLCQESCPLDTANMVSAARTIDKGPLASKVLFLSITVDPARDSPTQLAAYKNLFSPAPANWLLLTASPATLTALWKRLGVYIKIVPDTPPAPKNWRTGQPLTYDITHTDAVFFLNSQGQERFLLAGTPHLSAGDTLPKTLTGFLSAQGRQDVAHPEGGLWSSTEVLQVLSWLGKHPTAQPSPGE